MTPGRQPQRRLHPWHWTRRSLPAALSLVTTLVLWEALVRLFQIPSWLLPAPSGAIQELWREWPVIAGHAQATVIEAAAGMLLGIALAVPIATAMALRPLLRQAVYPLFIISQTIPTIALAPLILVWFGYGMLPKVLVVVLVTFFPLVVNLVEGYRQTDPRMAQLLLTMRARTWHLLRYLLWPQALPSFFAGLRIAATYSVTGAVVGEWLGAAQGLGIYLVRAAKSFRTDRLFAAIAVIVLLTLAIFGIVELLARLTMRWRTDAALRRHGATPQP